MDSEVSGNFSQDLMYMEEEGGKHQHLSVHGRWNPQLTA